MLKKCKALVLFLCGVLSAADDYSQWLYYRTIALNTTINGANIANKVTKFPVIIRLSKADSLIFKNSQKNGQDVRFSKSTGTHFPYHFESWDSTNNSALIWVLVDTIIGNNKTQNFKMYWGNPGAGDSSNSAAVFDQANGFVAVWHMNNNPAGGSGAIKDATAYANNGTTRGFMTLGDLVNAIVGKGIDFDGFDDGISAPDAASFDVTGAVTISAWFKFNTFVNYARIAAKPHTADESPWNMYAFDFDEANHLRGEISSGGEQYSVVGSTTLSASTLYHGAFIFDGSTLKLYLNGFQESNTTSRNGTINTNSQPFFIGTSGYNTNFFRGVLDEVRVSRTARSDEWIKLFYHNGIVAGGADSLTIPGPMYPMPPASTIQPGLGVASTALSIRLTRA